MVDVAAIFDDVFGLGDENQGSFKKRCARCDGVPHGGKPLEDIDTLGTPEDDCGHTSNHGVPKMNRRCARDIVDNQEVTGADTRAHRAHRKTETPSEIDATPPDIDAFEERSAIAEYDGGLPRQEAEALAAREQGHADADSLYCDVVKRWTAEIDRLAALRAVSLDGAKALKRAQAFIGEGWALQSTRLGWDEAELFGVCPRAPWRRYDRKGVAFGGAVVAVTAEAVAYVGGLRRYRAQVNNDNGAVPIWELAHGAPSNGEATTSPTTNHRA